MTPVTPEKMAEELQKNSHLKLAKELENFEHEIGRELSGMERGLLRLGFAWGAKHTTIEIYDAQQKITELFR